MSTIEVKESLFRDHIEGAYPKGTRVVKVKGEEGDIHPIGTEGVVMGCIKGEGIPEFPDVKFGYLVDFGVPTFIMDIKIKEKEE